MVLNRVWVSNLYPNIGLIPPGPDELSLCSSKKYPYSPPPLTEGTFALDPPPPLEISFQGVLINLPPPPPAHTDTYTHTHTHPVIFVIFQLG